MSMTESADLITHKDHYWSAADDGHLLIKHCAACDEVFYYPRPSCPFCGSSDTDWRQSSGHGTIYSFSILRRRGEAFFTPAYVTLEEGPTIATALLGDAREFAIGQAVELEFRRSNDGVNAPYFRSRE